MQSKWFGRVGMVALVAGVLAGSTGGCAAERDPINRVQANAMPKSFFVGPKINDSSDDPEFYARTMVIDVPYGESGGSLLFTNTLNNVSRIRWSIEEKNLIGRVSYERVSGTDGRGPAPVKDPERDPSRPLAQNDGLVVYNFPIESHFDIRRSYNANTGEESNTIEENATDRVWSDREYIRVDFSQNLVTTAYDFDTMALLGIWGGVKYSPMAFDVRNPSDENAPAYDIKNGYFDVTNKVFSEPQMIDLGGGFRLPACQLPSYFGGNQPVGNCNPNELTLRHAFKRVVDTDYEPADWDGHRFSAYGAFTTDRNGYARDYGPADAQWKRYISRYNVWERSHHYTNPDKLEGATACTVDDECSAIGGFGGISHCDTYAGKCTEPYQLRKEKPIVWHYADGSAPEYFDVTQEATDEWDAAMRAAIQTAKYAECKRYGNVVADAECRDSFPGVLDGNFADEEDTMFLVKEVNACRRQALRDKKADPIAECNGVADALADARKYSPAARAIAKLPAMVTLCHSPVAEEDPEACGAKGTVARLGDMRYHLVTAVAGVQSPSPWGIMTDANDPMTGEHIAASINVFTHVNDLFSRSLIDTFRYISGELTSEQITEASYVHNWGAAATSSSSAGMTPLLQKDEVDRRIAAVSGTTVESLRAARQRHQVKNPTAKRLSLAQRTPLEKALLANLQQVQETKASWEAPTTTGPLYDARRNQLIGTPVEAAMVTPAMQQLSRSALGASAASVVSAAADPSGNAAASVLQALRPGLQKTLENRLEMGLAARGVCVAKYEALAPTAYTALAEQLQAKFGQFNPRDDKLVQAQRADRMKSWLARRAHYAVIAHEMGHSFGLRHNFVSSSDSWNYRPQYWALRTNAGEVTTPCDEGGGDLLDGRNCVGPRWLDKVTDNEQKNMLQMWAQSSTMDYPGEPAQDLLGIGAFDFGAARMFYGDAVAVYDTPDKRFNAGAPGGDAVQAKLWLGFGGLLGIHYGPATTATGIHYSQLNAEYKMIEGCSPVAAATYQPASWDVEKDGNWSPLIDGHLVTDESGRTIKCTQPKVDFVRWNDLKPINLGIENPPPGALDPSNRTRVPHGFASDNWADLGNIAVFRHDNGADLYEQMHFWQAQQEMNHIFTNYRRGRRDFSTWNAFSRTLVRYLEKMRDSGKALGLFASMARDSVVVHNSNGDDPNAVIAEIIETYGPDKALASSVAFDHFTRIFARPQEGPHGAMGEEDTATGASILRASGETPPFIQDSVAVLSVPNGVSGGFGTIALGGRPVQNRLARNQGDYDSEYTLNVGSYYEKAFTAYLMTESADNFISSSREDFVDPRYRSVSLADLFPEGFRRWLANNLTNDEQIKGVYPVDNGATDIDGFATLGMTSWWPTAGVEQCVPRGDSLVCHDYFAPGTIAPPGDLVIDPQVGFEQQKFAMLFTWLFLPANSRTKWTDMLRVYDVSMYGDPGIDNRIVFHSPEGKIYAAQTYGTEVIYGKTVQKGIAARMLEYANTLLDRAVVTEPVVWNGRDVGLKPLLDGDGKIQYKNAVSCETSRYCQKTKDYAELLRLMHMLDRYLGDSANFGFKGVY